jgi:hypothetical protein
MDHKLTGTVPDEVYQPLVEEASKQGRTPEEEASLRLQHSVPQRNGDRRTGVLRELFGSVDLDHPIGIDNESIDDDLAREYANPHKDAD